MIKHWEILENKWTQNSAYVLGIQGDDNDSQIILRDLSSFCSLIDAKAPNFTHLFELLNISDDDILQKIRARIEDIVQKNSINRKDVSLSSTPLRASGGTLDFVAESADPLDNILGNGNTFRDSLSSSSDGQEINLNVNASLHLENTNVDAAPTPKEKTIQQETPVQPELEIKEPTPVQEPVVEEKIDRKEGTFAIFKKFFSFGKKKQAPKEQAPAPKKPEGPLPIEEFVAKTEVTKNDLNVNNTDKQQTKATDNVKKEEHKTMRGVVVKGTAFPAEELGAQKVADVSLGKNILDKEPVKDQSQNLKSQVPLDDIFAAETICQFYDDKNSSEQPKIEKIEEPTPMPTPRVITITQNRILEENLKNGIKKEEKPQVPAEAKKEEPAAPAQPVQNKVVAQKPAVSAPAPAPILTPAPKAPVAETPKAKAPVVPVKPEPVVKKPVAAPAPKVPAIPAVSAAPSMPTLKVEKKVNQPVQQENTNNVNSDKKVSKMPQITISEDEALKIKNIAMKEKTFTTTNKEPAKAVQQNKPAPAKPAPAAPVAPKEPAATAPAKPAPAAPVAPKAPTAAAPAKPAPVAPKPATPQAPVAPAKPAPVAPVAPQAPAAAAPAKPAPVAPKPAAPQAPAAAEPAKPAPAAPVAPQAPATNDAAPGQASKPIPMPHVKQEQIDGFDHTIQTTSIPVYKKSNWPIEMPIVPSFTLESMDMSSNRFAHAAAMTIVENPGSLYNPFFVFGEGGCGKTHFLNAIGSEFTKRIPLDKIFITNGVRFSRGVQRAIENGTIDKVKEFLDSAQVLIIDDIHLTAVNETNKDFISQVLNDYVAKRKQLVIASKYPPQGLSRFEELTNFKLDQGWISELKTLRPNHFLKAYMRMILDAQVDLTEAQCRGFFGRENLTLGLIAKDIKRIKVLSRRIQDSGSTALSYEQLLNYITAINGEDATSQLESLDLSSPLSIRRGENTNWGNFGFFFPKESMDKFKWMVYATMQRAKELGIKGGFNFALKSAYSTEHIIASAFKIANVCDSKNLKAAIILGPDPRIIQPAIRDNFCDILSHMLEVMMIRCAIIPYEDIKKPSSYVKVLGDVLK